MHGSVFTWLLKLVSDLSASTDLIVTQSVINLDLKRCNQ
jgi:hypothetical protein